MTTVEWRRLADGMAEPIMEVDMETEDERLRVVRTPTAKP